MLGLFFKRLSDKVEQLFLETSIVDLVSKLVVFFTLRAVVLQTDVLLGKTRDFKAFQSSLGYRQNHCVYSRKKKFLHFISSYFTYFFVNVKFLFFKFLKKSITDTCFFSKFTVEPFCEFCYIGLELIGATRSVTPMTF